MEVKMKMKMMMIVMGGLSEEEGWWISMGSLSQVAKDGQPDLDQPTSRSNEVKVQSCKTLTFYKRVV